MSMTEGYLANDYGSYDALSEQLLSAQDQLEQYLGTLGSGRTLVEVSEVRDLLLDVRAILRGNL